GPQLVLDAALLGPVVAVLVALLSLGVLGPVLLGFALLSLGVLGFVLLGLGVLGFVLLGLGVLGFVLLGLPRLGPRHGALLGLPAVGLVPVAPGRRVGAAREPRRCAARVLRLGVLRLVVVVLVIPPAGAGRTLRPRGATFALSATLESGASLA